MANPAVGVGGMKRAERKRAFTDLELKKFLPWLTSTSLSPNVRDAMRLTLMTACRSGEACGVEWSEVDLDAGVWTQPGDKTKNRRSHRVMLSRQVTTLLKGRVGNHPRWLFPSRNDRPILQKSIGFAQYEMRGDCPIKGWTVHDLRRTALTGMARLGCPRVVQDRIANHADRAIAAIYDLHSYDNEAQTWLQSWANHLDRLTAEGNVEAVTEEVVAA
jgi:integrase